MLTRRNVLRGALATLPLMGLGTGIAGFCEGGRTTPIRPMTFRFANLPPAFEGFTILHLTDLHLGTSKHVHDLERTLDALGTRAPDLIVFTGDIAEDVNQIAPAMRLARDLRPKHGVLATLGNHEYFRIGETRPRLLASDADLLVNENRIIRVGSSRLFIGGVDDPISMRRDLRPFYPTQLRPTFAGSLPDDFRLLLSHRPEAFRHVRDYNVDLTLSGHTHGGQIGFNGKSAFEPLFDDGYLWGHYRNGSSQLYTSSGFGSWFAFRLGCGAEAPLITLTRAVG